MTYPHEPGVRFGSTGGTAERARDVVRPVAPTYELACLRYVEEAHITPDEAHARLERELHRKVPLYSVRPRFSQLRANGLIADSGLRRAPPGGCKAVVWRATTPEERALFNARKAVEAEHGEVSQ